MSQLTVWRHIKSDVADIQTVNPVHMDSLQFQNPKQLNDDVQQLTPLERGYKLLHYYVRSTANENTMV